MAESTAAELEVQEKQEVSTNDEQTLQTRSYRPLTDIYERADALIVVMEMPGVDKSDLNVTLENDMLEVSGQISLAPYSNMEPLYTEYGVGHYARRFRLPNAIDKSRISASIDDGVLTLTLPKRQEEQVKSIEVQ